MIGNNYRPSLLSNFFPIFLQHLAVFMISRSKLMIKKKMVSISIYWVTKTSKINESILLT